MGNQTTPTDRWAWLRRQIKTDEGLRLAVYLDTATPPKHTVGWGHNLEAKPVPGIPPIVGHTITRDQAERLLERDMLDAVAEVRAHLPWTDQLALARFDAMADMAFNLGIGGLVKFPAMLHALQRGDWPGAVREMDDSKWSHQVDDGIGGKIGRADRLAAMILSGQYPA